MFNRMIDKTTRFLFKLRNKLAYCKVGGLGAHALYGQVKGHQVNIGGWPWITSQAVKNKGGKFVFHVDGELTLCVASTTMIQGWAQERERTPTAGDKCTVNCAWDAVYRMPLITGTTYLESMRGDSCDIEIGTSVEGHTSVQCCAPGTSSHLILIIVDGDLVNSEWVDVMMNPFSNADREQVDE